MATHSQSPAIFGQLQSATNTLLFEVQQVHPYTLLVSLLEGVPTPDERTVFDRVEIALDEAKIVLGPCRYEKQRRDFRKRASDVNGSKESGQLIFTEDIYDFKAVFRSGNVVPLDHKLAQLPLVWNRKTTINPIFKDYTGELTYDLQVYRAIFDDIDRNMSVDPIEVQLQLQNLAIRAQYEAFAKLFDRKLGELQVLTSGFSQKEHETHGFYFRKQLWDIIMTSEFMARTNIKPRGYAGDSVMMRMIYENRFRGSTIFSKFMHRHPIQSVAAQAVRNRRGLLSTTIASLKKQHWTKGGPRFKIMSVACGPAAELKDVIANEADAHAYELALLDQDEEALAEARENLTRIEERFGVRLTARYIHDSVRTMLRTADIAMQWGQFDFIYSMGLFDYLTKPVAESVLEKLYQLALPGGELMIGNFHVGNPTRRYMEYWMDWVLYYRSESELLDLGNRLPGAECRLSYDETGSQMFLRVKKRGAVA